MHGGGKESQASKWKHRKGSKIVLNKIAAIFFNMKKKVCKKLSLFTTFCVIILGHVSEHPLQPLLSSPRICNSSSVIIKLGGESVKVRIINHEFINQALGCASFSACSPYQQCNKIWRPASTLRTFLPMRSDNHRFA